jgi:hypothetical protein
VAEAVGPEALDRSILRLGAQAPDVFLHNHRRKPRGFRYGALLHRKGNDRVLAYLAEAAAECDCRDDLTAFSLGYISHVWFDRVAHPYINWSAGWRGVPDAEPERPAMHAFLERLIDVRLLEQLTGQSIAQYAFASKLPRRASDFFRLRPYFVAALREGLRSAADDAQLALRILNALHDALGFYRYTESPDRNYFTVARKREREGQISPRWLSIVHPPAELITLDVLNRDERTWRHPCDWDRASRETVIDLFHRARRRSIQTAEAWLYAIDHPSPANIAAVSEDVGPYNLNDGITADPPCRRRWCRPLPLVELYRSVKTHFER